MRKTSLFLMLSMLTAGVSGQTVLWDEDVDGDITDDWAMPLDFGVLTPGSYLLSNTVVNSNEPDGDRDFFTITIPAGAALAEMNLVSFVSGGGGFIGMIAGGAFGDDPANIFNPADLLGYNIYTTLDVGNNILPGIGSGSGAQGFTTPLGPGTYTFWSQETASVPSSTTFEFVVVPAPASAAVLGFGALAMARRRR